MILLVEVGRQFRRENLLEKLFRTGARVIMACRDLKKCEQTREKIVSDSFNTNVVCRECDLASIESIKNFADEINKNEKYLHLLINNAGVMWHPSKLTKDGFEQHLGVNYLGMNREVKFVFRESDVFVFKVIFC